MRRWHENENVKSYLTNLLEAFEPWTRLLDEGHGIDVIFLDYCKAFDAVDPSQAFRATCQAGTTWSHWKSAIIKWIKNFLPGRHMRVIWYWIPFLKVSRSPARIGLGSIVVLGLRQRTT